LTRAVVLIVTIGLGVAMGTLIWLALAETAPKIWPLLPVAAFRLRHRDRRRLIG